jgi:DNA-directed RNA polymerase beta' subunit
MADTASLPLDPVEALRQLLDKGGDKEASHLLDKIENRFLKQILELKDQIAQIGFEATTVATLRSQLLEQELAVERAVSKVKDKQQEKQEEKDKVWFDRMERANKEIKGRCLLIRMLVR